MVYKYVHWYPPGELSYLTDEEKIERTKKEAAIGLAEELLRYATYNVEKDGSVHVRFEL